MKMTHYCISMFSLSGHLLILYFMNLFLYTAFITHTEKLENIDKQKRKKIVYCYHPEISNINIFIYVLSD